MSLAEVENMFTLGGSEGMLSQEIMVMLGILKCILVHSEEHTELLEKSFIIIIIIIGWVYTIHLLLCLYPSTGQVE